jgi:DNA-binding CsgD family transcriptional regulator
MKDSGITHLSKRDLEVIRQISKGYSSELIANKLRVSLNTIIKWQQSITRKLSLKSVAELFNYITKCQLELDERVAI